MPYVTRVITIVLASAALSLPAAAQETGQDTAKPETQATQQQAQQDKENQQDKEKGQQDAGEASQDQAAKDARQDRSARQAGQDQAEGQATDQELKDLAEACGKSWTKVDENQNGVISPEEAERASEAEFERIDVNNDQQISVKEWKACATPAVGDIALQTDPVQPGATFEGLSEDDFAKMDEDKSGDVTPEEAGKYMEQEGKARAEEDTEQTAQQALSFGMIDTDDDNKISKEEWQQREQASLEARFSKLDKDGDGELTKSEFTQYRQQRFGEAQKQAQQDQPTVWTYYFYVL